MRWRWVVLGWALVLGLFAVASTARVAEQPAQRPRVALHPRGVAPRVLLVFIDSLSRDVATDARTMPTLHRLAREGASFDVEPCRDQLTYLCIRAVLTGRDDSSLLAVGDNFRPNQAGPPESLLSALAATGRRVSVVGTSDFHPYRQALFSERPLAKEEETPERVSALVRLAREERPGLLIVSLGSGDMTAHAHGVHSPEYTDAFRRLDATLAALSEAVGPGTSLVVFGDHGHDALGRHLPGTGAHTWAVYRGPAFRAGAQAAIALTDHRALLGLLLGVPTEPSYRGPPLSTLLRSSWVESVWDGRLPQLQAPPSAGREASAWRWFSVLATCGSFLLGCWLLAPPKLRGLFAGLSLSAAVSAAAIGFGYDALRSLVHDHGDSPERGLCLLIPLALGGLVAAFVQRAYAVERRLAWLPTATACAFLVTFLLLLPTAYYYGARRAVVLAAVLAITVPLQRQLREHALGWSTRATHALGLVLVALVLLSFYQVRQLGPETAGAATWALSAPSYAGWAWLSLVVSKAVLFGARVLPRASRRPFDAAFAALLLGLGLSVELGGLHLPRGTYLGLLAFLALGGWLWRRQAASSLLFAALLLLDHLYAADATHLAPLTAILAASALSLALWPRLGLSELAQQLLAGCTVTLGLYLMFWPTVGFHLAGIDFGYMFQWVPAPKYEQYWWVIGLGLILKLALPLVLVLAIARAELRQRLTLAVLSASLASKVALLALMITAYSVRHSMASQQALAMLAELVLLLFGVCVCLAALPRLRATAAHSGKLDVGLA